jgi:molybdate transport system substrate-binding protein
MCRRPRLNWQHAAVMVCVLMAHAALEPGAAVAAEPAPSIAAASDLKFAMEELAAQFKRDTGHEVRLTFGSSGNFQRQIEQGAPFEMFLSADEAMVYQLADKSLTRDRGALYAVGRIVLFVPERSPIQPSDDLEGLRAALAARQITHFAIANPEHAPYGRAAKQALRHAKLWDLLQPYLVLGENVSQAAQFAATGNCQGGITAYSLALAPSMQGRGRFSLIPGDWHRPLRQRMVLLRKATPTAERFYAYMQAPAAREIMNRYGFVLPDE